MACCNNCTVVNIKSGRVYGTVRIPGGIPQAITTNTLTALTFTTLQTSVGGVTQDPSGLVIPKTGFYQIDTRAVVAPPVNILADEGFELYVTINGAVVEQTDYIKYTAAGVLNISSVIMFGTSQRQLNASDIVGLSVIFGMNATMGTRDVNVVLIK